MEFPYNDNIPTMLDTGLVDIPYGSFNPLNRAMSDRAVNQQMINTSAYADYPPMIDYDCSQFLLPNEMHTRSFSHSGEYLQPSIPQIPVTRIDPNSLGLEGASPATSEEHSENFHQESTTIRPSKLHCKWQGCTYFKPFSRTGDLIRHVKSAHLTRGQYHCPFNTGCKSFNRKDNLVAHIEARHKASPRNK